MIDDDVRGSETRSKRRRPGALKYATHEAKAKSKRGDALSTCLCFVFSLFFRPSAANNAATRAAMQMCVTHTHSGTHADTHTQRKCLRKLLQIFCLLSETQFRKRLFAPPCILPPPGKKALTERTSSSSSSLSSCCCCRLVLVLWVIS